MKKIVLSMLILFSALSANADVVWPSLYITKGMLSLRVIFLGLIIETIFVKYFACVDWKKSCLTAFLMNLITTVLGVILIPLSGLGSEIIFDAVFHTYDKYGIGTFHWSHWLASYLLVIILNTIIEGSFIKLFLKLGFKKIFWWLLIANGISVFLCIILYGMKN